MPDTPHPQLRMPATAPENRPEARYDRKGPQRRGAQVERLVIHDRRAERPEPEQWPFEHAGDQRMRVRQPNVVIRAHVDSVIVVPTLQRCGEWQQRCGDGRGQPRSAAAVVMLEGAIDEPGGETEAVARLVVPRI